MNITTLLLSTPLLMDGLIINLTRFSIDAVSEVVAFANNIQININLNNIACYQPKAKDIRLLLYTRNDKPVALNIRQTKLIDPKKQIIIIIHGWFSDPFSFGFPDLRNAYLKRYDSNVIMLDWSKLALNAYTTAYCFIPKVARQMSKFLCGVKKRHGISLSNVHLVGHSFGAQMSSFISRFALARCGEMVGRITAMDPAKPIYQNLPESLRLDKEDATFVDVLHTDQHIFGYSGDCGHVDFYVNCGHRQPGCPSTDPGHILRNPIAAVSCDHFRSVEYMTESVNSNSLIAKPCVNCMDHCRWDDSKRAEVTVGEHCPKNATGSYVVFTNSVSPYGRNRLIIEDFEMY